MGASADAAARRQTASAALRHAIRVEILTVANERPISPARFVDELLKPRPIGFEQKKQALSHVAYHFRELQKAGCIEIVEVIPRRGASEHVYRGTLRAHFTDEEWADLDLEERHRISTIALQGLLARIEGSILADTFDAREDRWLAWTAAKLDDRGWAEMTTTIAANFAELERIRGESEARLEESGATPTPVTFGMLGFESPPSGDQPDSA
jgi:hypothetical protein